ncbi:protein acetyltransferase, partial [Erwinia amylovora]|nr:protein acetyltransferase [Erwinia amylovora]
PERYLLALSMLLNSQDLDALLIIHAPSTVAPPALTASKILDRVKQHPRAQQIALLTNWCGEFSSQEARQLFNEAGITTYLTPEGAVSAFIHMVEYRRNQKQLRET